MSQPAAQERVANDAAANTALSQHGPVLTVLLAGLAVLGVVFFPELRAAVEVWNASTAYSHCYLVVPMTLFLLWDRRDLLVRCKARPENLVALGAIPIAAVWLIAERLGIMEGRQLAAIAGIELLFLAVLGRWLYWQISGPLLFLLFLVPFGAFLTPALQQFTAAFSVAGLNLLGIPNYSDKFTIETPAGIFFVAEACAGLRFLIAAIAFGVFYALLNYTSPVRRFAFIAASIVVPIIANGFRALGIVVLGQVLGSAEAAAADHIIYGWVFFSFVMILLIAAGQTFREAPAEPVQRPDRAAAARERSAVRGTAAVILLLALGPAAAATIDARSTLPVLPDMISFVVPPGCLLTDSGGDARQRRMNVSCDGVRFDVRVDVFPVRSTSSAMNVERRRVTQEIGAEDATVAAVDVPEGAGRWTVVQTTDPNRVTAYASWVDGAPVPSGMAGRIAQARDSLLGSDHAPALMTITAAEPAGSLPVQRKAVLDRLRALVQSQSGLDARMDALTRAAAS